MAESVLDHAAAFGAEWFFAFLVAIGFGILAKQLLNEYQRNNERKAELEERNAARQAELELKREERKRDDLYELACAGADPNDSLPDVTARVGAVEERVAELEARVTAIEDGTMTPGSQEPPVEEEWPEWVRPTSKDTKYHKGDKVTFEGVHYVCNKNNVVTSPAEDQKSWIRQD